MKPGKVTRRTRKQADYRVNGRVWVERDGELYLGWGRIMLLERIKEHGSLAAAARSMRLAYRNAWLWVDAMNRLAPKPLVEKRVGGGKGGYARVTEEGERAISRYVELRRAFQEFVRVAG